MARTRPLPLIRKCVLQIEFDEKYARYDIFFKGSVTGLKTGNAVRYRGVPVGVVTDMGINPDNVEQVRVTIEVPHDTPVKEDAVASLEFQGITGVAYVQITGGTHDAAVLVKKNGQKRAVIPSKFSGIQEVLEAAPELINRIITLVESANKIINEETREDKEENYEIYKIIIQLIIKISPR